MSEWVSVNERKPESYADVLAYVCGGGVTLAWYSASADLWCATAYSANGRVKKGEVTHWMPLPDPPIT